MNDKTDIERFSRMLSKLPIAVFYVSIFLFTLFPGTPEASETGPGLLPDNLLRMIVEDPAIKNGQISICIRNCATGEKILQYKSDQHLVPASNQKILTGGMALLQLGTEYRYKTDVCTDGSMDSNGVLHGNLYLKGFGDPVLVSEQLWLITKELYLKGLRRIDGDIIADDSYFDDLRKGKGWKAVGRTDWYMASIGALSLNFNTVTLLFEPVNGGTSIRVTSDPPTSFVTINNTAKKGKGYYHIDRNEINNRNEINFSGKVSAPGKEIVNIINPPMYTATVFSEFLRRWGVTFNGKIKAGILPETTAILYRHRSKTLAEIVMDMNYFSNNFMAEQILKTLGAEFHGPPGTAEKGINIIFSGLKKLDWNTESMTISDGSGLSNENRVSSSLLSYMLYLLYNDHRFRYEYVHSLPIGGVNGTLKNRMQTFNEEKRIRAKSGRIRGVSATSGYLFPYNSREPLAFSILINNFRRSHNYVTSVQDKFLETILNHYKNAKTVHN